MKQEDIARLVAHTQENIGLVHKFTMSYDTYMRVSREHLYRQTDARTLVHILMHICQNPGITFTEIVRFWGRGKSTISSQLARLERDGLIYRVRREELLTSQSIFPTEAGEKLVRDYSTYDEEEFRLFLAQWEKDYTAEEIIQFFEMMKRYMEIMDTRVAQLQAEKKN